jgi:membrane-bound serine protease (ClpP class)
MILLLAGLFRLIPAHAAESRALIYRIDIKKEINPTTRIYLSRGLNEAQTLGADAVLIHLNTYGGLLDAADSMRTAILYSSIPIHVFIDNNAASAGALISLACDKIYMRRGASIGAATVVDESGGALPDKYQSYMRSMMRSTAEAHGKDTIVRGRDTTYRWKRDPQIAEAMVDDRIVIRNLIDSGKTLTLTASEAIRWGYCDGIAESVDEIITRHLGYGEYSLRSFRPSWTDDLRGFLMNPILQSLLILVIIGGIYFELQTPGIGFPLAAAIIAAVLYFSPLYIEGLAQNWEILLFVLGLILIALEIFVIPGFGIAGISGIILMMAGFILSLLNNVNFNFEEVSGNDVNRAFMTVLIGIVTGMAGTIWLFSRVGTQGLFRRIALNADLEHSVSAPERVAPAGMEGVAITVMRPSGKVIVNGELHDGISLSGFIDRGSAVRIIRFENAQVYVESVPQGSDG